MSVAGEPEPILRVTVGSAIYTSDERKIGTVKERRAKAFKVGTPLLQRDCTAGEVREPREPGGGGYRNAGNP